MEQTEYHYECNNCDWEVDTTEYREARECDECTSGMLVNVTIQE